MGAGLANLSQQQREVIYRLERGAYVGAHDGVLVHGGRLTPVPEGVVDRLIRKGILGEDRKLIPGYRARIQQRQTRA